MSLRVTPADNGRHYVELTIGCQHIKQRVFTDHLDAYVRSNIYQIIKGMVDQRKIAYQKKGVYANHCYIIEALERELAYSEKIKLYWLIKKIDKDWMPKLNALCPSRHSCYFESYTSKLSDLRAFVKQFSKNKDS